MHTHRVHRILMTLGLALVAVLSTGCRKHKSDEAIDAILSVVIQRCECTPDPKACVESMTFPTEDQRACARGVYEGNIDALGPMLDCVVAAANDALSCLEQQSCGQASVCNDALTAAIAECPSAPTRTTDAWNACY